MSTFEFFIAAHFYEKDTQLHLREISVIRSDEERHHFLIKMPQEILTYLKFSDQELYFEKVSREHGLLWSEGDSELKSVNKFLKEFLVKGRFFTFDNDTLVYLKNTLQIKGECDVMGYTWTKEWNEIRRDELSNLEHGCQAHDYDDRYNFLDELACTMARAQGIMLLRQRYNYDPKNYTQD